MHNFLESGSPNIFIMITDTARFLFSHYFYILLTPDWKRD